MSAAAPPIPPEVAWHDAECGGYGADLPRWERLARERSAARTGPGRDRRPVLDLGAGTGRVALHLAARGYDVVAVERDAELLAALRSRTEDRRATIEPVGGDVRELALGRRFPLVIAPMQLVHLLGGRDGRRAAFARVRDHLAPGGAFALTILREPVGPGGTPDPIPDVREVDGWVHSSLPLEVGVSADRIELIRLRQLVSPSGSLSEEVDTTVLDRIEPAALDRDLEAAGLRIVSTEPIEETAEHVGSLLVVAEAADA